MTPNWTNYSQWLSDVLVDPIPQNIYSTQSPLISQWSTDTRTIKPGDWFIPLSGSNFDGHKFIELAIEKGASGFLYSKEISKPLHPRGIRVNDCLRAYQSLARGWRLSLTDLTLIALTGSNGKTTTKEMLSRILQTFGLTYATEDNFNNEVGVPKSLLNLSPSHKYAVLEFGARKPGNIRELVEIAQPNVSLLLNAGLAHVGIFGSVENLRNTKLEIFRYLKPNGIVVYPQDDLEICLATKSLPNKKVSFGISNDSDIKVDSVHLDERNFELNFNIHVSGKILPTKIRSPHQISAINAGAAMSVVHACGLDIDKACIALSNFSGVQGRFQLKSMSKYTVIDDSYNANPNSMAEGLKSLDNLRGKNPLILVLGDMLELGDKSNSEHRRLGSIAAKTIPDKIIYVGAFAREFLEGAVAEKFAIDKIFCCDHVQELISSSEDTLDFVEFNQPIIYIKASRGIQLDKVVNYLIKSNGESAHEKSLRN